MLNEEKSSSAGPEENLPNQPVNSTPENQTSAQTPPVVKNEKPKPSGKSPILKSILLGVLFVIGLALIGGAYFMGTQKSNDDQAPASSPAPTKEAADPTAGWQTYTSADGSYSVKYDPAKFVRNYCEDFDAGFMLEERKGNEIDPTVWRFCDGAATTPTIHIETVAKESSYQSSSTRNVETKNIAIDGVPMTRTSITVLTSEGPGDISKIIVQGKHNGKIYSLSSRKEIETDFDQILSTFKFTDSDSSSSQNGYTSKLFKVSFNVPSGWNVVERDGGAYPSSVDIYNYDFDEYAKAISDQKKNTPDGFSNLFRIDFSFDPTDLKIPPTNTTLMGYLKSEKYDYDKYTYSNMTVDGSPAVFAKRNVSDHLGSVYHVSILKGNKIYEIGGYSDYPVDSPEELKKFESTFKEFLSTFKFN